MKKKYVITMFLMLTILSCESKSAVDYLLEAEKFENKGNYIEAIKSLDKAISIEPDFIGAYINRGADYSALKKYSNAIEDYKKVLNIDPDNVMALYNIGNNYKRLEKYALSIDYYNKAYNSKKNDRIFNRFN